MVTDAVAPQHSRDESFGEGRLELRLLERLFPALTAMVDRARSGGNEVLVQVLCSLSRKLRKRLGLHKKPAGKLQGTGA